MSNRTSELERADAALRRMGFVPSAWVHPVDGVFVGDDSPLASGHSVSFLVSTADPRQSEEQVDSAAEIPDAVRRARAGRTTP